MENSLFQTGQIEGITNPLPKKDVLGELMRKCGFYTVIELYAVEVLEENTGITGQRINYYGEKVAEEKKNA